jgi:GT2 family glycosyltransferase
MPGPRLSIIIVNYNVRFFLEQCLHSVEKAVKPGLAEIFVVDNNSLDGSCSMVEQKFPEVKLIRNSANLGFSKANNQAIRISKGEYVLLLNPDTVVEEDTFEKVIAFMDSHEDAGALGVKMIDGKGHFLPESKRALPTPWVSFYKIFGLSALFPRSRKFGKYHLGYLDKDQTHEIDVLPGAFMMIRKEALDKAGLLDESFFMYGEDIDLSFRISKAGYKVYYYPGTTIIHYKGESTKKGSINYVLVFYQAMIIFARKHFSPKNARLFYISIKAAIYFRAFLSLVKRFFSKAFLPIADAGIALLGLVLINPVWEAYKFPDGGGHPPDVLRILFAAYLLIWITSIFFSGGYDKPLNLKKLTRGTLIGTAIILVAYSLLPEEYRFSRALIIFGTAWNLIMLNLMRLALHISGWKAFRLSLGKKKRVLIVGRQTEYERIMKLLGMTSLAVEIIGRVKPAGDRDESNSLGEISQMEDIININKIDELIFSAEDMSTREIIQHMLALTKLQKDYKIAPPESPSIIGSNSVNTAGDLYVINLSSIAEPSNKRLKRMIDISFSLLMLISLPLSVWFYMDRPGRLISNILKVLTGKKSWVGYYQAGENNMKLLPVIREGVLLPEPADNKKGGLLIPDETICMERNLSYARDYNPGKDLSVIFRNLGALNS